MSMLNKKTIEDINVNGKRVLVRCDFNVPLKDGVITDENRLNGALPTINYLIENGAKMKDVQARLGHSRLSTTMDTYTHSTNTMSTETVDIFENFYSNSKTH